MKASNILKSGALLGAGYLAGRRSKGGPLIGSSTAKNILKSGALLGAGYFAGRQLKRGAFIGGIGATRKHAIDREKIVETYNFVMNDYDTYKILTDTYFKALDKKKKAKKYDAKKAVKLFHYFLNNYVRREMKKPRKYGFDPQMNPAERDEFGKMLVEYYKEY